ncbi:hypothetical protein IWW55_001514 [Coemansia sp. RSA 2706]|nr:hypothetical protein IWW55_001514 [Coemansia sp. RSA 2706]KAJ2318724.1 hypothetical protein IWW52_002391 [Coemansia sp. RSA 2704]
MPDPATEPNEFARVSFEINQLRDFLSHIQVVSESEDLSAVEPLVRIAEPVQFSADNVDGGLKFARDPATDIGRRALEAADQTNGPFFIVED